MNAAKKWAFLFLLAIVFDAPEMAWNWIVEVNERIYGSGDVHVGCTHKRKSDGKYLVEIVPEMVPYLLASETAAIVDVSAEDIEVPTM